MSTNEKRSDGRDVQADGKEKEVITREDLTGINNTATGEDRTEENRSERRFQEEHGNRKYKMHKNEPASKNQPRTNTGPGTV